MRCKVCNSDNNPSIKHKTYKCNDCGHTFINYTDDGILFHKELYRKPGHDGTRGGGEVVDGKFTEAFHNRRKGICENRIKKIEQLIPESNSLLDIGAGGGTFLNMIKDRIDVVEGTEVSDLCAANLNDAGYKVYHGAFTEMEIDKTYDLVTCWHVLEHVENLEAYVERVKTVVDNYLVIEVPINRRLKNPDNGFDGHFHYFSRKSLTKLFENDFNIVFLGEGIQNPALLCILQKK